MPALAFLVFLLVQLVPIPGFVVALISPFSHDLYQSASKAAGVSILLHPLSLNGFATLSKFLQYTAYFMLYLAAVNTLRKRSLYLTLVCAIVASALFQAVYGLYELFSGGQYIFWYKKKYFLDCATGTFINRNHYSVYVGLSIPMLMSLIVALITEPRPTGGSILVRISRFLDTRGGLVLFLSFFIGLLSLGVAFSLSLTGIGATIVSCVSFVYFCSRIQKIRKTFWIVVLAGIIAIGVSIAFPQVRQRILGISGEIVSERSRFMVWKDTLHIFLRFPLTGTGAGTFPEIFPVYRSFGTSTTYSQTHNEYLQQLSETGILMAFLLIALFDVLLSKLRRTLAAPLSRLVLMQTGAFSALLLLGLHNLVDFSFRIPAVAVTSMILTALLMGSYHDEQKNSAAQ